MLGFHGVFVGVSSGAGGGVGAAVGVDDELSEALVLAWIDGVADDAEDVETGEDGFGELDVLRERDGAIVAAADWIGGCDDGTAGLEGCDDAGFGDGDGLLFHGLVDRGTILVIHLVEFVDETGTAVSENESATFQSPFARHGVSSNRSCKTDG